MSNFTLIENRISQAKVQLLLHNPFFAVLALKLDHVIDVNVQTAQTDGKCIKYNPKYVENMSDDVLISLIAHEIMHCTLLHFNRRNGKNLQKFNSAGDYALNLLLKDSKFTIPSNWLIDEKYRGMSTEQIYNLLPDENENENPYGVGGVEDEKTKTEEEKQSTEQEMKKNIIQAAFVAKQQGNLPAYIQRIIEEILEPKVDWKVQLAEYLTSINKDDYSWKKINTRYLNSGFILPSLYNENLGEIILAVDTSGSIDQKTLNIFASEMQEILNTFNKGFTILYCDDAVTGLVEVEPDDNLKLQAPKGRGGTSFYPVWDYIKKHNLNTECVVYLTDLICNNFGNEPEYPVIWAQYGKYTNKVPFGNIINITF